ncbi:MAG: GNAT family N-acetyltransferase [Bacteroidia bacterium]
MHIQQKDDGKNGSFFIEEAGKILAQMTYVWAGNTKIIIDHTEVNDQLKGQSAGKQMLAKLIDFARDKKLKVMPLCPFAKSVFDKVAAYQDVLF